MSNNNTYIKVKTKSQFLSAAIFLTLWPDFAKNIKTVKRRWFFEKSNS
jgi:hypothetical protein